MPSDKSIHVTIKFDVSVDAAIAAADRCGVEAERAASGLIAQASATMGELIASWRLNGLYGRDDAQSTPPLEVAPVRAAVVANLNDREECLACQ